MTELEQELRARCDKMAFLLGISWSCLRASNEALQHVNCMMPNHHNEAYITLLKGIEELFYSGKV